MTATSPWVEDRQFSWLAPGLVLVALFMLQVPDGFTWAGIGRLDLDAGSNTQWLSKVQWLPLFGLALFFIVARFRLAVAMLPHLNWWLVAAAAWITLSAAWSYDPSLTLRRSIKVVGTLLIGWGVVMVSWDVQRYERTLRWGILLYLLASLAFMAVQPTLGIHQAYENEAQLAGSWRGLSTHKNPFGVIASVGMVLWVHAALTAAPRKGALAAIVLCLICLVGARSSTALICAVMSIGVLWLALRTEVLQRPGVFVLGIAALFVAPALWFIVINGTPSLEEALGPLTTLVGRDLTFTGRVPLWNAVLEEIPQHPWFGTGYQAFWGPYGSLSDAARVKAGWPSVNGHNGYLDTANEIGVIGLALVLVAIAFDIRRAIRFSAFATSLFALHLSIQFYQLLSNLSETMFMRTISLTFLLTSMSSFHLARVSLQLELARRHLVGANRSIPANSEGSWRHAHP